MYQHGSASPDTFSRLPATGFLPPLHIQLTFFHPRLTNIQISRHATTGTAKSIGLPHPMRVDQNRPTTAYSYACHVRTFQSSSYYLIVSFERHTPCHVVILCHHQFPRTFFKLILPSVYTNSPLTVILLSKIGSYSDHLIASTCNSRFWSKVDTLA